MGVVLKSNLNQNECSVHCHMYARQQKYVTVSLFLPFIFTHRQS